MDIQNYLLDDLIPYARNARTHSPAQVAQIASSIREFGFCAPVLIDENDGIIAGHGRVLAARKLGLTEVPCVRLTHLTSTQRRAYILADNQLAIKAGWDMEMLALEIEDLKALDFDIELTGFDADDLAGMDLGGGTDSEGDTEPQIDRAEELREQWGVKPGDLWVLGEHRLLCGDSTKAEDVERLLQGDKPLLMVTDPPYGVEYDPGWREQHSSDNGRWNKKNTKINTGKVLQDDKADWREAWALFPGDVAYVWHASLFTRDVIDSLESCEFQLRALIIWAKQSFVFGRGHYHWQHEPCGYTVKKNSTAHWIGDRKQTTVWQIRNNSAIGDTTQNETPTGHGTQKPLECMERPIRNHESEFVYEPFSGSGTTLIACQNLKRKARAIEISPAYVAVALERFYQHTQIKPIKADGP